MDNLPISSVHAHTYQLSNLGQPKIQKYYEKCHLTYYTYKTVRLLNKKFSREMDIS